MLFILYQLQSLYYVVVFLLQWPEVRSGDVLQPILLKREGQEFNFTNKRGVSTEDTVSVNCDDFITDVAVGDILLVDGKYVLVSIAVDLCMV